MRYVNLWCSNIEGFKNSRPCNVFTLTNNEYTSIKPLGHFINGYFNPITKDIRTLDNKIVLVTAKELKLYF